MYSGEVGNIALAADVLSGDTLHNPSFLRSSGSGERVHTRLMFGMRLLTSSVKMANLYTVGVVTCRPTARQAQDYYRHAVVDNADWAAVDKIQRDTNPPPD